MIQLAPFAGPHLNFIGYGVPNAPYWFIGVEEGGDLWSYDNIEQVENYSSWNNRCWSNIFVSEKLPFTECDKAPDTYYANILKIVSGLEVNDSEDAKLCEEKVFTANLFPLAKKRSNHHLPESYKKLFQIGGPKDWNTYVEIVSNTRWPKIFSKWQEESPQLTICHGKSYWWAFAKLFRVSEHEFESTENEKVKVIKSMKLIFTHHLSWKSDVDDVLATAKSLMKQAQS